MERKRSFLSHVYQRKQASTESTAWAFVNSAFGLWCLSSLVIGGLSFAYTQWDARQEQERKNFDRIRMLKTEVSCRLWAARNDWRFTGLRNTSEPESEEQLALRLTRMAQCTAAPWTVNGPLGVFPDLDKRDLVSLLLELRYLDRSTSPDDLDAVIDGFRLWPEKVSILQQLRTTTRPVRDDAALAMIDAANELADWCTIEVALGTILIQYERWSGETFKISEIMKQVEEAGRHKRQAKLTFK